MNTIGGILKQNDDLIYLSSSNECGEGCYKFSDLIWLLCVWACLELYGDVAHITHSSVVPRCKNIPTAV